MALRGSWGLCLVLLGFSGLTVQETPVSVELSCGAGPVSMLLVPGKPLFLDCHQGVAAAADSPFNVTWLRDGEPLEDSEAVRTLPNGSLAVLAGPGAGREGIEGGYSCLSAGPFGALASRTLNLQLPGLSRFLKQPEAQVAPVGGAVHFDCSVDGLPQPIITWEKDLVPVPEGPRFVSLPNGALQILGVREEDRGAYRCTASNSARKRFSQNATLTVTAGPSLGLERVTIAVPPRNTTVVSGRPAVLECLAQGLPKPLVSWSRQDGKPIAADAVVVATNLLIQDTRHHHAGVYVCRADNHATRGSVTATAELRVLAPPAILQAPETVTLSRGNTARLVCRGSGQPPPALRWLKDGQPLLPNGRVKAPSPGVLLVNQLGPKDAGYYQCVAANRLGVACAWARLSVIVREGLPSAPRLLSARPDSGTAVRLSWRLPELNSDRIVGFSVHYQQMGGSDNVEYQFAVNNDTTEYYVRDLLPHATYTFYVVAYSPMGASRPSLPVTVEMLEDVPSSSPQVSLLSTSPTNIHATWLPLDSQPGRGAVTRYRIEYCAADQEDDVSSVELSGNDTQVTLRGLQPGRAYRVRLVAGTHAGFGTPSEWVLHQTPGHLNRSTVVFAPTELKVRAKMDSLYVTWQAPPNLTQVSGYKLYCWEVEPEEQANGKSPKTERSFEAQPIKLRKRVRHHEITGLSPDRLYEVRVRAYSKRSDGYAAAWKGRTERAPVGGPPRSALPPPPPSGVRASANSSTSIWLRWEELRFGYALRVVNYTVRWSPAGIRNASLVSYYTSSAREILLGALKPFTRYALAVQSNGPQVDSPFSSAVEESTFSDRPSSPPTELQLSPLDPTSVLVTWLPPLEPNGIIVEYRILYSGNGSQPEHGWTTVSRGGGVISTKVQGLQSATRYFFKMGACTEVGAGPFTPVKDVLTPSEGYELDAQSVAGIIVGVCLALLCILLCMFISLRGDKAREGPGGRDFSPLPPPQGRRGRAAPPPGTECTDYHELEALMASGDRDAPRAEVREEEHGLLGTSPGDSGLAPEPMPAWNGSVSRNWANRITRYRDTITEDGPDPSSGSLTAGANVDSERPLEVPSTDTSKSDPDESLFSVCSCQIEAEVIVHSGLSDQGTDQGTDTEGEGPQVPRGPPSRDRTPPGPRAHSPDSPIGQTPCPTPAHEAATNHSGPRQGGAARLNAVRWAERTPSPPGGGGLANGFHSPEPPRACNGHLPPLKKALPALQPPASPGLPLTPPP